MSKQGRVFFAVAAAVVLIEMIIDPRPIGPDGVAYLDMGDAILGLRPWAIAAYFSPLYAVWIALAAKLAHASPAAEPMVVRAASGVVVMLAAVAFEMLLTEVMSFVRAAAPNAGMRDARWRVFGYGLFLWSAMRNGALIETTPDIGVMAAVFAATTLVLRMTRPDGAVTLRAACALGLVLGLGYLTKAVMFINALMFLGLFALFARRSPRAVAAACAVFATICAPWIAALSASKGRATFGETGRMQIAFYHTPVRSPTHWQGGPPGFGTPVHPTRLLMTGPEVFEFAKPFPVSYPPWYDASYWYEGVKTGLPLAAMTRTSLASIKGTAPHLWMGAAALLALVLWGRTLAPLLVFAGPAAALMAPAVLSYLMYSTMALFPRYLSAWAVLLYLSLVVAWGAWNGGRLMRAAETVMPALLIVFAWQVAGVVHAQAAASVDWHSLSSLSIAHEDDGDARAAEALLAAGVRPGDPVAAVGSPGAFVDWMRLGHLRMTMESPGNEKGIDHGMFWRSDASTRERVVALFRSNGVKAVVSDSLPAGALDAGWTRIPGSRFAYFLPQR